MFYKLKSDCYFRRYGDFGYIVRPIIYEEEVVDASGIYFIEQLNYEFRNIENIVNSLLKVFEGIDYEELKRDAIVFYDTLVSDGFIDAVEDPNRNVLRKEVNHKNIKKCQFSNYRYDSASKLLIDYSKKNPIICGFHIELLTKCNERCIHCYIPHSQKNTEISFDLMMDVLEQCKSMGVLTVVFSGGEPMLHPNFCDFLKKAKDLDINVTVLSNLTIMSERILECLKYRHPTGVNVSVYSMDEKIHDSITTVVGSHKRTISNILTLIENDIPVKINCPIMAQNKDSFVDVIKWAEQHNIVVIPDHLIMAQSDRNTDVLKNRIDRDDLYQIVSTIVNSKGIFRSINDVDNKMNECETDDDVVCGVGITMLCMISSGDVYPCVGWKKYLCGNLNKQSLSDIWNKSTELQYLRKLRFKDFKQCKGCKDKNYCAMCISRNSNEDPNGDIFNIPQITCDAAEIHHKVVEEYRKKLITDSK